MTNKVQGFIASERELSQLKHWLKSTYRISIEEFVVLYKVFEGDKKELISKLRSETDERQVYYFFNASQKKLIDKMINEIEAISIAN